MRLAFLLVVAVACASPPARSVLPAADTAGLVRLAKQHSPRPDSARVTQLFIAADTARVTVFTHDVMADGESRTYSQHLPFARTKDGWKLDDTRQSSDTSVVTPPPLKVP